MNGGLIGGYLDGWLLFGWVGLVGWWLIGSSFGWLGKLVGGLFGFWHASTKRTRNCLFLLRCLRICKMRRSRTYKEEGTGCTALAQLVG